MLLLALAVSGVFFLYKAGRTANEPLERVVTPTVGQAPEAIAENSTIEEEVAEEASTEEAEEEEAGIAIPDDPTLYLTVPRLGLYEHTVRNDDSEAALDLGAIKLPYTDFPWQKGDTNTYIACHRLGWPGNESYNQCLDLPSMQEGDEVILKDVNGTVYEYRVVETLAVEPEDAWVTEPIAGKDMVSLQTCIETIDDLNTLGPNWSARFVVRAERSKKIGGPRRLVEDSIAAYASLLHTPFSNYVGVLQLAERTAGGVARNLSGMLELALPSPP